MEVHAQVTSQAKLFSGASTEFGGEANAHVSLVDAAMPGMLPVINAECVRQAVRTGLGLKARINLKSVFDRKNYFYPDLPQGYQISQYKSPIVGEGEIAVDMADGETVRIGIERLHLEQDAGKSLHEQNPNMSLVDLNRAGVALMEIVSKPDLRSADEAKAFVAKLRSVLRYLGTCDGDMEKGNLRADVNVSVRKPGAPLGTRCEIKNVNSIRFIGQAIEHEARRQIEIIEDGGKIEQETRLFDPDKGETRSMRTQGRSARLPLLSRSGSVAARTFAVARCGSAEEPAGTAGREKVALHARLRAWRLRRGCARRRARNGGIFRSGGDRRRRSRRDPKLAANWVINELLGRLNREGRAFAAAPVSAAQIGAILDLIGDGTISGKIAKDVFEIVWTEGGDPRAIVEQRGLKQVTDVGGARKDRRRHRRQEPGQGRRRQDQPESDRLVRRPGDEGVGRQGQSAGRQRPPEEAHRNLSGSFDAAAAASAHTLLTCVWHDQNKTRVALFDAFQHVAPPSNAPLQRIGWH